MVRGFFESCTNAPEVLRRRARMRFGVSVPIAEEEESFTMVAVNLGLFSPTIGLVGEPHANISRSRTGGELHRQVVFDNSTKELSSGFVVSWPELSIVLEGR